MPTRRHPCFSFTANDGCLSLRATNTSSSKAGWLALHVRAPTSARITRRLEGVGGGVGGAVDGGVDGGVDGCASCKLFEQLVPRDRWGCLLYWSFSPANKRASSATIEAAPNGPRKAESRETQSALQATRRRQRYTPVGCSCSHGTKLRSKLN